MVLSELTSELINRIVQEIKKKDNMEKIQKNVIDPVIGYSLSRIYPYILVSSIIFILLLVLVIATLFLIIKLNYR
tara:strand:- start:1001 stop:1225 length:225 start_codon:yes stop_codon:yes gene_type:complete